MSYRHLRGETFVNKFVEGCSFNPFYASYRGFGHARPLIDDIGSEVIRLRMMVCPPAVLGLVIPERVYSVQRSSVRSFAHVSKKRLEGSAPFIMDIDASPTIIGVMVIFNRIASLFHGLPASISWASRKSVSSATRRKFFSSNATAASCSARKPVPAYDGLITAITHTHPSNPDSFGRRPFCVISMRDNKTPVTNARSINQFSHGANTYVGV